MKIEKATGYKVGEQFFSTLSDAQYESLKRLLTDKDTVSDMAVTVIGKIMDHTEEVIAILQPPKELRSRAPRKDKGTKRGPKTKPVKPLAQVFAEEKGK